MVNHARTTGTGGTFSNDTYSEIDQFGTESMFQNAKEAMDQMILIDDPSFDYGNNPNIGLKLKLEKLGMQGSFSNRNKEN